MQIRDDFSQGGMQYKVDTLQYKRSSSHETVEMYRNRYVYETTSHGRNII